jgi:hypothetical protein
MSFDIKKYLHGQIELGLDRFIKDLEALDEECRNTATGGIARSPYDMAYELVEANKAFSQRLTGEVRGPIEHDEPSFAPKEFRKLKVAVPELKKSTEQFLETWSQVEVHAMEEPIEGCGKLTPLGIGTITNRHIHYHDAQLNYIQTHYGDDQIHW